MRHLLRRHERLHRDGLDRVHRVHVHYGDSFSGLNHPQEQQQRENDRTRGPKQNSRSSSADGTRHSRTHTPDDGQLGLQTRNSVKNVFPENFLAKSLKIYHDQTARGK